MIGEIREKEIALAVVDTRRADASDRLDRELRHWRGYARLEWIDEHHAVLLVRPGGAMELLKRQRLIEGKLGAKL